VSARSELLELALSPELLAALDEHIRDVVDEAIREERRRQPKREWLTFAEGAVEYGCTYDALRARADRGTVESMRKGRVRYVRAPGTSSDGGSLR
jgi:hypothetical protein